MGGVTPGRGGQEHLGRPVFNSVAEVMTAIFIIDLTSRYIFAFGRLNRLLNRMLVLSMCPHHLPLMQFWTP